MYFLKHFNQVIDHATIESSIGSELDRLVWQLHPSFVSHIKDCSHLFERATANQETPLNTQPTKHVTSPLSESFTFVGLALCCPAKQRYVL